MRPLKLTISAFESYATPTVINVDDLGEKGLYMITGDTGSGKTAIFDAIVYALYGEVSGQERRSEPVRCRQADYETETYVEMEFMHKGKIYVIKRSPEQFRLAKKGKKYNEDGTPNLVKRSAECELKMPNDILIDKVKEVDETIKIILGVECKQFLQIAMLAQGEFRKLLLAGTSEKTKIFRMIFCTEKYEILQSEIKNRTDKAKSEFENIREKIRDEVNKVNTDSDETEKLKEDGVDVNVEEAIEVVRDIVAKQEKNLKKVKQQLNSIRKSDKENEIILREAERVNKLFDSKEKAEEEKERLEHQYKIITELYADAHSDEKEEYSAKLEKRLKEEEADFSKYNELDEKRKAVKNLTEKEQAINEEIKKENLEREERQKKIEEELVQLKKEVEEIKKTYDENFDLYIIGQAGILAETLKDGVSCPVCGSKEHPNPAIKPKNVPTKEIIDKQKKIRDKKEKELERTAEEYNKLRSETSEEKEKVKIEIRSHIDIESKKIYELEKTLKYKSGDEARNSILLIEREIEEINDHRRKTEEEKIKVESDIKNNEKTQKLLKEQTEGKEKVSNIEILKNKKEKFKYEISELENENDEIAAKITTNNSVISELEELSKLFKEAENNFKMLNVFNDTVNGGIKGKERLSVETYVQTEFFENIVVRANKELHKMTGNRYSLERKKEAGRGSYQGLELIVRDMWNDGIERGVHSLSGGEMFKASLSLAIGLSEEVAERSGGIQIETLFIDEGFGSLDKDSLDQAIKVLQEISRERLIGIISHVTELKTMISRQIIVTKKSDNGSSIVTTRIE